MKINSVYPLNISTSWLIFSFVMHSLSFYSTPMAQACPFQVDTVAAAVQADAQAKPEGIEDVTLQRTATINGQSIRYLVTAGTLPVVDAEGQTVASLFYVYYRLADLRDVSRRPLTFSFNGGPGSASVWMHLGYTSPRKLKIDPEGFPVQPYGVEDNPHSILDVTDIVYIDPVNTGFSRPVGDVDTSQFFGVQQDIQYLARWIEHFTTRYSRWTSPKILKGESYGTTRVAGLARRLQSAHRIYVDGVILVSPTDMGLTRSGMVKTAFLLPHYAATAWYHQQLDPELQGLDLDQLLQQVEDFSIEHYLPALVRGNSLEAERYDLIANQVARYAGVSPTFVNQNNLMLPIERWRKELLRDQRLTVGRLDARYRGVDRDAGGESYEYDPALTAWNQSFTPAINHYLREELGVQTNLSYNIFGPVSPWDRSNDNTAEDLRRSMAENPWLKVMVQAGYYDGGTDYFSAKYTLWNMDRSGQFRDRLSFHGYRSGHMMYLRDQDLPTSNEHIRQFIRDAIPRENDPARYDLNPAK